MKNIKLPLGIIFCFGSFLLNAQTAGNEKQALNGSQPVTIKPVSGTTTSSTPAAPGNPGRAITSPKKVDESAAANPKSVSFKNSPPLLQKGNPNDNVKAAPAKKLPRGGEVSSNVRETINNALQQPKK
jgi:hypothetical protein